MNPDNDQPSQSQVNQNEVLWLSELLILSCDPQCHQVNEEATADQDKHAESQQFRERWACQEDLYIQRDSCHSSSCFQWDVEFLALSAA